MAPPPGFLAAGSRLMLSWLVSWMPRFGSCWAPIKAPTGAQNSHQEASNLGWLGLFMRVLLPEPWITSFQQVCVLQFFLKNAPLPHKTLVFEHEAHVVRSSIVTPKSSFQRTKSRPKSSRACTKSAVETTFPECVSLSHALERFLRRLGCPNGSPVCSPMGGPAVLRRLFKLPAYQNVPKARLEGFLVDFDSDLA